MLLMTNCHLSEKKKAHCCKGRTAVGDMKRKLFSQLFHPLKGYTFPSHKRNILYTAKKVNWNHDQTGWYEIRKNVSQEFSTDLISHNSSLKQKHLFMLVGKELQRLALILPKESPRQGCFGHPILSGPCAAWQQNCQLWVCMKNHQHLSLCISTEPASLQSMKSPWQMSVT